MTGELKTYYLLQASYWIQQIFVLVLKIEKPRSDYVELCIHVRQSQLSRLISQHCVTLWLIGWSYALNLTYIGVSIFVTSVHAPRGRSDPGSMDLSDTFLAVRRLLGLALILRAREVPQLQHHRARP